MEKTQKAAKKTEIAKQHKSVESALFAFQSEKVVLSKNGTSKASNGKEYNYVTLDDLINAVRPGLMAQGLLFTQLIQTDTMETKLIHADTGTSISSVINLGKPNNMQDYGARITYARRYALTAILGLNAEDDTDAVAPQSDPMQVNSAIGVKMPQAIPHSVQTSPALVVNVPRVPEALKSEGYRKAKNAIDTAYSTEALEVIKGQIDRSQKLSAIEKDELSKDISTREVELGEVVRNN